MVPLPTPVYHITHVRNLPGIVAAGGLQACSSLDRAGQAYTSIAYPHIQDRRATKPVPCGPRGTLHDYVPCYCAPRSPMLYTINRGNVAGYDEGQEPIIHLVAFAQTIQAMGRPVVLTDGHAVMTFTTFYADLTYLDRIDWDVMNARIWADTPQDGDRKRRRQAELLVYEQLPWEAITTIGVINKRMQARVQQSIDGAQHQPAIAVRPGWYY